MININSTDNSYPLLSVLIVWSHDDIEGEYNSINCIKMKYQLLTIYIHYISIHYISSFLTFLRIESPSYQNIYTYILLDPVV